MLNLFLRMFCLSLLALSPYTLSAEVTAAPKTTPEKAMIPSQQADVALFTPPTGWRLADSKALPPSVKVMVVGKGAHEFPPSMNLGTEKYDGTLQDYLKLIKSINDAQGSAWKDPAGY